MKILFSAIAKRKLELLSVHLIIVWNEEALHEFLTQLEDAFAKISSSPKGFDQLICNNIYVYKLSEQTSLVYLLKDKSITVLSLFDSRQNPTIVYHDLIEHFS